jgi:hypothetical protein
MVLTQENIKQFACHLKTLGAYVKSPIPGIFGLSDFQVIGSQDAKSLYPTIMVLCNIGYDSLYGRVYDWNIVGKILTYLENSFPQKDKSKQILDGFSNAINVLLKNYTMNNDVDKKKDFMEFNNIYLTKLFRSILLYNGKLEDVYEPKDDESYFLLKSCLFPLLESLTWLHENNKGYNNTILDWIFYNDQFNTKYKDQQFVIFENINSVKCQLKKYNISTVPNIFNNYLLNTYGTLFYKHDDKKSFEVDLILRDMDGRGFVKNQGLILKGILENWTKIEPECIKGLYCSDYIDKVISEKIIEIVGDNDEYIRKGQLESLQSIIFNTQEIENDDLLIKKLKITIANKDSESNAIKVTLNSGYGIYAMATWNYGNALIANSITNGGKILGIKLFQQIASNVLDDEQKKFEVRE